MLGGMISDNIIDGKGERRRKIEKIEEIRDKQTMERQIKTRALL